MKRLLLVCLLVVLTLVMVMPTAPISAQTDVTQVNKAALQNAADEFSNGNPQPLVDLFPESFLMNGEDTARSDSVEWFNLTLLGGMPDIQMILNVMIGQDDWVAVEVTYTGTFTGTMDFGEVLQPTNEVVSWTELDFLRFDENGLIVENWTMSDPAVMLSQFGLFPPMEEDEDPSDTPLESPAGYEALSDEELAATFASGNEERNIGLYADTLVLGVDTSSAYSETYVSWQNGVPFLTDSIAQAEGDVAFTGMIATALPDHTVTPDITVAEGDWVATLVTVNGTFTADTDFFGTPLTHNDEEVFWQLGILARFDADGQIVEEWIETDTTSLFVGLGLFSMDEEE